MEARSLASLNYLAANPPQYPVNPTEQRQESLTLYISRVPGTRDVILSPFKPQLKNVTAEDVASSLYYIHLDSTRPDDLGAPRHVGNSSDEGSPSRMIKRKPVGGTQRPDTDDELPPPPQPPRHLEVPAGLGGPPQLPAFGPDMDLSPPPLNVPSRRLEDSGVGLNANDPLGSQYSETSKPQPGLAHMPARKPLGGHTQGGAISSGKTFPSGSRPEQEPFTSSERPYSQQSYNGRSERPDYTLPHHERPYSREREDPPPGYSSRPQSRDFRSHPLQPRPLSQDFSHPLPPPPTLASQHAPPEPPRPHTMEQRRQSRSLSPSKSASSFNLSLIRRDPSSGNQWNVGRISSRHFDSLPPPPADDIPAPRPPIDIQLETSGYAKFRNMPARRSVDASAPQIPEDIAQEPGIFSRQVVMTYSKSLTSTLKRQTMNLFDKSPFAQKGHTKTPSFASQDSAVVPDGPTTSPGPDMKPRGYVFNSPWDGRCEFRTGNAGRSVRCQHILHEGPTANYNPLVAEQQATGTTPPNTSTMLVSELRFNLPSSELLGNDDQGIHQRRGNFRKFWKRDDEDYEEEDDDEVSPFDMNLGREKAGGGNRGKRAKMGKLIIYHDGLKMLDLVVAANVGVWWGAWERNF